MSGQLKNESLNKLLNYLEKADDVGFDPYDIFEKNKFLLSLQVDKSKLPFYKLVFLYGFNKLNLFFPLFLRKLFGIKKMKHATYMACMFRAYLEIYEFTKHEKYLTQIQKYRDWLIENRCKTYQNFCWGTPFAWRSGDIIYEKGTPFTVVTAWVGDAFHKSYTIFKEQEDLDVCLSICKFFVEDLIISEKSDDEICFSYSPLKRDYVNNANLFAAEFLMRIGSVVDDNQFKNKAKKAVYYSINHQLDNGMITYLGRESAMYSFRNDSYHSSYEIRMLYSYWVLSGDETVKKAIDKYLEYYLTQYYKPDGRIVLSEKAPNVVDITALSDAILMFYLLQDDYDVKDKLAAVMDFTIGKMQDKKGFFYYKVLSNNYVIKIPYIRWAQGWMAMALAVENNK
jgi:hypothetical protein